MGPHLERMCRHQIILQAEKALDSRLPWQDGACDAVPLMGGGIGMGMGMAMGVDRIGCG